MLGSAPFRMGGNDMKKLLLACAALVLAACGGGDASSSGSGGAGGGGGAGGSGGTGGTGGDPTCPALPAHQPTLCDAQGWCAENAEANLAVEAIAATEDGFWLASTTALVHRGAAGWSQQEALPIAFVAAADGALFATGWEGIYERSTCGGFLLHPIDGAADFRSGWAASANDAWFAATAKDLAGTRVLVHWDGSDATTWPVPDGLSIRSLWGAAPDDVWGAGPVGLVHWDGSSWTVAEGPAIEVAAIWGSAADDLWAVGRDGGIARWDGAAWATVASPTTGDFVAVTGSGPDDVWIASDFVAGEAGLLHWDGATLAAVDGSEAHGFHAIAATGHGTLWAASTSTVEPLRQLIHWSPAGPGDAPLRRFIDAAGISAAGEVVWVLGADGSTARFAGGGVERFTTGADRAIYDLEAVADGTAWAVGEQGLVLRFGAAGWEEVSGVPATWALLDVEADGDEVWIAGASSQVLRGGDDGFATVETGLSFAAEIAVRDGAVWAAGEGGAAAAWNGSAFEARASAGREPSDLAIGPGGDVWLLADGGLFAWDDGSWALREDDLFNAGHLAHDDAGTLWVSGPMLKRWTGGAIDWIAGGDAQGGIAPAGGSIWTVGYGNAVLRWAP